MSSYRAVLHLHILYRLSVEEGRSSEKMEDYILCDFGIPPRSRWELRSSGLLRTDVSGQTIGHIFKGQKYGIDKFSRNVGKELPLMWIKIQEMQQYADIYSLQNYSTCFGCHSTHHQVY